MAFWLLLAIEVYLIAGALFSVYFATLGVVRLDKAARGTSVAFRLLLLPGAVALWPYLLIRLLRGKGAPRDEHNAHRDAARKASR